MVHSVSGSPARPARVVAVLLAGVALLSFPSRAQAQAPAAVADLRIEKSDGRDNLPPGSSTVYTIVARNMGPAAANGAVVNDPVAVGLTKTAVTCQASGGAVCPAVSAASIEPGVAIPTFPAGSSLTFTVAANVTGAVGDEINNFAFVTPPAGVTDPNTGDNVGRDKDFVVALSPADLSITITDGVTTVTPGSTVTYTVVARNGGPSGGNGAVVSVPLPATLTSPTWTCVGAGGAFCAAFNGTGSVSATTPILPNGGSLTYTITATLSPAATGTLSTTATIAAPAGVTDPVPGNNTATDTDTIPGAPASADLSVTITDGVTTVTPGSTVTYTVVATNGGPSAANGATLGVPLPATLTGPTWTCTAAGGAACAAANGAGSVSTAIPTFPSGGSVTYAITSTLGAGATGTLSTTATVTAPAGVTDPALGNNTATDTDTIPGAPPSSADLSVTITDGVTTVTPGSTVTYTVVATNGGPSAANGATLGVPLPATLTGSTWTCTAAGGAACAAAGGAGSVSAAIPTFPSGGSVTYVIGSTLAAGATGALSTTATVTAPAGVTDPALGNNTATDTDTIPGGGPAADLSASITNGVSSLAPGASATYTAVFGNGGPAPAGGSAVTVSFSGNFTGITWTCTAAGGAACAAASGSGPVGGAVPTLPLGGTVTYTLTGTVSGSATGTVTANATIAAPAGVIDPVAGNNSASDADPVPGTPPPPPQTPSADLSITKSDGVSEVVPGQGLVYTIVAANAGPDSVSGATVTDSAPAGLTFGTWTCVASSGSNCPASGSGNISASVSLLVGGTATFTLNATVAAGATGSIENVARISTPSGTSDPTSGNNTANDTDVIRPPAQPRVDITKALVGVQQVGSDPAFDVALRLVVRNTSTVPAPNVQVTDDMSGTFAAGSPSITIQSGPSLESGTAQLSLSSEFNGTSRPAILTGTDTMAPGTERAIVFTVRVRYASAAAVPVGVDLWNTARSATTFDTAALTSLAPSVIVTTVDESTDVTFSGAAPRADDVPQPTAIRFTGVASPTLSLQKVVGSQVVEVGDTVAYAVRVTNVGGASLPATVVTDRLPRGFTLVAGTSQLAVGSGPAAPIADPEGAPGPTLVFRLPAQPGSPEVTLSYRVRVGPGAFEGDRINRAEVAIDGSPDTAVRGAAGQAGVVVSGGVFSPDACVIGRVFVDGNGNRILDRDEVGVSGVRLRFENGTVIETDVEGKYSYCGLTPVTHVLKVDRSSLPEGARLVVSTNRNVGDAESQFIDVVFGDVRRADFAIDGVNAADLLARVAERKARGEVWTPLFEALDRSVVAPDQRRMAPTIAADGGGDSRFSPIQPAAPLGPPNANLPDTRPQLLDPAQGVVGTVRLSADRSEVPADGRTPVRLTIRVAGADGQPLASPVVATIETSGARLQVPGSLDPVPDADRVAPGTQLRLEGGETQLDLVAPDTPRDIRVRVTAGEAVADGTLSVVPALAPLHAVGIVEGAISLTRGATGAGAPTRPTEAFQRELQEASETFDGGRGHAGARGALFLQGAVKGDYLVTMAYDSERADRGVLFRDIQPDAFYPIYGDGSVKRFDAQTSGRFYLRADRGRSHVFYGDLQTAAGAYEAQQLGIYSRTLTGLQHHFETRSLAVNVFASRDTLRQVIDEMGARGISGPYTVSNPNGVSGTEKVEIVTRDRNQPAVVLSAVPLTRYTDYEFEPFSGRLLFRRPIQAVDERLNPVSIRVTYEVDRGGEKAWVGGADAQFAVGRHVQFGGSWAEDDTQGAPYRLRSVNGTVRLGGATTLVVEGAQSTGVVNTNGFNMSGLQSLATRSGSVEGGAARIELRHQSRRVTARLFAGTSDPEFNNPASTLTGGRSETGGRATVAVNEKLRVVGEAIRSEDRLTDGHREGALVGVEATLARGLGLEVGMRRAKESIAPAQGTSVGLTPFSYAGSGALFGFTPMANTIDPITGLPLGYAGVTPRLSAPAGGFQTPEALDVFTVRARLTATLNQAVNAYGEAEQDVRDGDKRVAAVGGQYRVTERNRLFFRHEFISSLDGPYALSDRQRSYNTVFGVSSTYLQNADAFTEYRMRDAISGREAEAAIGLRNLWPIAEGLRLSTGIERLHAIGEGQPGVDQTATAASLGVEYTRSQLFKSTGRIEFRRDPAADSWLSTLGLARKISDDWTLLAKNYYQRTLPDGLARQLQDRFWLGGAYRDLATNRLNLLSRYEFIYEDLGSAGLVVAGAGRRTVHAFSTHADARPTYRWLFSGQHAAKWVEDGAAAASVRDLVQLVSGRAGYDLTPRIDVAALSSLRWGGDEGRRYAVGGEVGFRVYQNVWLSGGYNVTGFVERDVTPISTTARGGFVRMRVKFDEDLFRRVGASRP